MRRHGKRRGHIVDVEALNGLSDTGSRRQGGTRVLLKQHEPDRGIRGVGWRSVVFRHHPDLKNDAENADDPGDAS